MMTTSVFSSWKADGDTTVSQLTHGGRELAAVIAWGEVAVTDSDIDPVDLCATFARTFADYSCGQCTPCREGSRIIAEMCGQIAAGQGQLSQLAEIKELADCIARTSFCDIGQTSPKAIGLLLDRYQDDFVKAITVPGPRAKGYVYRSFVTSPCMQACPIHLDVTKYIEEIKLGRFQESLATICDRLPLPGTVGRVCVRPCEAACQGGRADGPLQIKHLKRFVADAALARPATTPEAGGCDRCLSAPVTEIAQKEVKVAIVGAGPAGLTCAHFLAKKGYKVTIYEILPEPGGMAAVGIPDYRLPRDILRGEVEEIKKLGVEILYNKCLGIDFTLEQLKMLGFRAIFIGMGCHCHKRMGIEGEQKGYYGYIPGVLFLRNINLGLFDEVPKGKKIVVVGGGNVAIDCVRIAFRLGFGEAHIVYRRSRKEMPADPVEIHDAEQESVQFHFLVAPKRILGENGRVTGIECYRMELGEPDASGRRRPVAVADSEFVIDADVVVAAIGQEGDVSCSCNLPGVDVDDRGVILVDENLMSSQRGVFAGGDCITGPDTLIGACAHGRLVGLKIARYLEENVVAPLPEEFDFELVNQLLAITPAETELPPAGPNRIPVSHEPAQIRKSDFREVDKGFTTEEAMDEASRCHRCYKLVTYACKE